MMTPITRALAEQLIEEHFADGSGDIAGDYARHIPVRIIAQMLGIPLADEAKFTGWVLDSSGSYVPMFIIAGMTYLVALLVIHLLVPRMEPAMVD